MVHVVTSANRYLYEDALDQMFRMRHHVAVNELGWTLPNMSIGHDEDQFDLGDTIYFLEFDDQKQLVGTARLNPTTRPHLMTEIFSNLCEFDGVPAGPDIYEYSRFLVKKTGVSRRTYVRAQANISLAIVEYCLAAKIKYVTWVTYRKSYALALRMWKTRPLGLPQYFASDDEYYIAGISDMTEESLQRTRALAKQSAPVCRMTIPLEHAPALIQISHQTHHLHGAAHYE